MLPHMCPPETTNWDYPGDDVSWKLEFEAFVRAVSVQGPAPVTLQAANAILEIVQEVYRSRVA